MDLLFVLFYINVINVGTTSKQYTDEKHYYFTYIYNVSKKLLACYNFDILRQPIFNCILNFSFDRNVTEINKSNDDYIFPHHLHLTTASALPGKNKNTKSHLFTYILYYCFANVHPVTA